MPGGGGWYLYSGGGAGGGGAGQTITKSIALTKGTVIPMVVGAAGGATSFGTHATALAGSVGNNGGNASCVHTSFYDCGTSGGPGGGGAGGYSYGSAAGNGAAGTGTAAYATYYGGTGGKGGVSIEGTYGNGGKGSDGGWQQPYGWRCTTISRACCWNCWHTRLHKNSNGSWCIT